MDKQHIQHLYWRAGFGLNLVELHQKSNIDRDQILDELFAESADYNSLLINTSELDHYSKSIYKAKLKVLKVYNELNAEKVKEYNYKWFYRMVSSKKVLREKMTLFWANHFVVSDASIKSVQQYNNVLRKYALGNFQDFIKAISKEMSMIKYLNLIQNNKKTPNENFARELLELFTLGVGNYSEKDIKEAARAFTGYKANFDAEFVFNKKQHDFGVKEFLGKKGKFDGDEIIDIIIDQRQCARFICEKIYKYFVNDKLNNNHVSLMTDVFHKDYNIEKLMRFVFASNWFYSPENIGSKIKSPIELLVGMHKVIPLKFNQQDELLRVQNILDQKLLFPPNVAGWKGSRNWINTNSMLVRVKLPSMILENESYTIRPRGNFTKTFRFAYVKNKYQEKLDVYVNWKAYKKQVKRQESKKLLSTLILSELTPGAQNYLRSLGKLTKRKNLVKIMSLPEYQMC